MEDADLLLVMCTVGTKEQAATIAHALVERRLAACVKTMPVESCYRWAGTVQQEPEVMLHIKTIRAWFAALCEAIIALHDYDVPEIVAVPIADALPAYADWVRESVG